MAADHVHRRDLAREAVIATRALEVQLADRDDLVAALAQHVVPARHGAVVGVAVVPVADLEVVLAGGESRARRHADRRGGVGVGETRAARRQPVEVGGRDDRMAGASHDRRIVLVRHQDDEILRLHGGRSTGSAFRAPASARSRTGSRAGRGRASGWRRRSCRRSS